VIRILFGQRGISIARSFVCRRSLNARLRCIQRKNLLEFAAHNLIAFACRFFEPRPVNLDQAPPSRSDGTRRPEFAHDQRHRRSSYPEQFRERLRVSGMALPSIRSWMWSNHRAMRASTGCNALQAATCWNCINTALVWV
jgi:hypothetical protein